MIDHQRVRKILVLKPSSLGDVVHSLPFLHAIRTCFPAAEVHWVIAKGLEGLLEGNPMIDQLIVINKDAWKHLSSVGETLRELRRLFRRLRLEHYDLVVDLQGLLRSGLMTAATGSAMRIGFSEAREGSRYFYTQRVAGGRHLHAVDRYLRVAAEIGCATQTPVFSLPVAEECPAHLKQLLGNVAEYVVIVPGARWQTKIWPAENFGQVAAALPVRSIVVGSAADDALADRVVRSSRGRAVSVTGRTDLRDLIWLMQGARFALSNDSGPMHIAAALNTQVIAVFGPTDADLTGPYGSGHIILRPEASCAPCFRKSCPELKCMASISVECVIRAAQSVLSEIRAGTAGMLPPAPDA